MNAAADDDAALGDGGQGRGHQGADGGEDNGGIQGRRRRRSGIAGPDST